MHEPGAQLRCVGQHVEELGETVRHADIVDKDADVEVLQLGADPFVNLASAGEVDVDHARLHSVLSF